MTKLLFTGSVSILLVCAAVPSPAQTPQTAIAGSCAEQLESTGRSGRERQQLSGEPRSLGAEPRNPAGVDPSRSEPRTTFLRDVAGDVRTIVGSEEHLWTIGLGLGASAGVRPMDRAVARAFNSELEEGTVQDRLFELGEIIGSWKMQVAPAFMLYGLGRLVDAPEMADLGRDLARVQVLSQGLTQIIKRTVRRGRPDGSGRTSFPSGHASGTFATAALLQRRYGWKIGAPAFGVATYVAASRLNANKHFLSDIPFGVALGLVAGRSVRLDRGSIHIAPVVAPHGAGVQVSVDAGP